MTRSHNANETLTALMRIENQNTLVDTMVHAIQPINCYAYTTTQANGAGNRNNEAVYIYECTTLL